MSFLDKFRKPKPAPLKPEVSLSQICWSIAYIILPRYAFNECDRFVSICLGLTATAEEWKHEGRDKDPAGVYLLYEGCKLHNVQPKGEDEFGFRVHLGEDEAHDYFLLAYPTPPPVDLSHLNPAELSPRDYPLLAPYFSVVMRHCESKAVMYYTLGQSPVGGTTVRSVTADGTQCNHGPGPKPDIGAFLTFLHNTKGQLRTHGSWK